MKKQLLKKQLLKIAHDMAIVRKNLKSGKLLRSQALALARVAEVEIRAILAVSII